MPAAAAKKGASLAASQSFANNGAFAAKSRRSAVVRTTVQAMAKPGDGSEPFNPYGGEAGDVYVVDKETPAKLQEGLRRHTISVYVSDERGMINRVAGVFARRGFNIESLAVGLWGPQQDKALFTLVVLGEDKMIKALVKQVYKLPSVKKVLILTDTPRVERGLVLLKINCPPGTRSEILETVQIFRGSVVDVSDDSMIIVVTGDPGKGIALQRTLAKYGIIQIARTGKVALQRELPQEAMRRQMQIERTMELDEVELDEPKSLGVRIPTGAEGTDVYASNVAGDDWVGIWETDNFDESTPTLAPGLEPHTLSVVVDNMSGVLDRVTGVIARRGYNVQSLAVGPAEKKGVSRITMVIPGTQDSISALLKQLRKLVSVLEASNITSVPFVQRELMLVKVNASPAKRSELMDIAKVFRLKISDISNDSMVLESIGDQNKMTAVLQMLQTYGIIEVARTGRVALTREGGVDSRLLEKVEMDTFF